MGFWRQAIWRYPRLHILHKNHFEKSLYYHSIVLEASKLGDIDSNKTLLEGATIKFNIFRRE